jgi:hypothetical protein
MSRHWELDHTPEPPQLLTPAQAEQLVGLRAERLRDLSRQAGGPATVILPSRRVLFIRADLLAWIVRQTQHPATLKEA